MPRADSPEDLPLALVGCDWHVASSRWRSQLVLGDDQGRALCEELRRVAAADGLALLNTCNRNEWIVSSANPQWAVDLLRGRLLQRLRNCDGAPAIEPYSLIGEHAARHILRVAIGRESLVLGERQIAGQLFRALEGARSCGTSSRALNGLSATCGRLVRKAIACGLISATARGVHSLALDFLDRRFRGQDAARPVRVAVVGLGMIGRRLLGLLEERPGYQPLGCNRSPRRGARPLSQLNGLLREVDAAVFCTGAPQPVLRAEHLADRERPLLVLDLGIPHQVASELPTPIERVDLDGLCAFDPHDEQTEEREVAQLINRALAELGAFCRERSFAQILDALQKRQRQLVHERIPELLAGPLQQVPESDRGALESGLRRIVFELTSEVFRTVKETSRKHIEREEAEEACPPLEGEPCRDAL